VSGRNMMVAHALSRTPLRRVEEHDNIDGIQPYVESAVVKLLSAVRLNEAHQAAAVDCEVKAVIEHTVAGLP